MRRRQAYASSLPAEPMAIPRNAVLVLYAPSGSVSVTATHRSGSKPWTVDLSALGMATTIPLDGRFYSTAFASGAGSVGYYYSARELAPRFFLDTVSPGIPTSNSVASNGGSSAPNTVSNAINVGTSYANYSLSAAPPSGKRWRIWAVFVQIYNDCVIGQNLEVQSMALNLGRGSVLYASQTTIGFQFGYTPAGGWALPQYSFGIFGLGPTGFDTMNIPGAAQSELAGPIPYELVLEPNVNLQFLMRAQFASGADVAYLAIVPLGVEEPL